MPPPPNFVTNQFKRDAGSEDNFVYIRVATDQESRGLVVLN